MGQVSHRAHSRTPARWLGRCGKLGAGLPALQRPQGPNLASVDPETEELAPLFNPRVDTWSEHFALVEHHIVGLTVVGRATATLLDMNDSDRIQVRAELAALGQDVV